MCFIVCKLRSEQHTCMANGSKTHLEHYICAKSIKPISTLRPGIDWIGFDADSDGQFYFEIRMTKKVTLGAAVSIVRHVLHDNLL